MKYLQSIVLLFCGSFAFGQSDSEIYLFDVTESDDGMAISNQRNITKHTGYDNQPFFHPSEPLIYYSSFNEEGRSDIKSYNYATKQTNLLTQTSEREYSPTVTPDGKYISCIIQRDDGAQDLGKYPIGGGSPIVLIDNLIVGYHAWISDDQLLLFVLGDTMTLRLYDLTTKTDKILAENIGRSLHKIPGQEAMSFVQKQSEGPWLIKRLDIKTQQISEISQTVSETEDLTWTPDGRILMSDGVRIGAHDPKSNEVKSIKLGQIQLTGITRLALSPNGKLLAVVADE